MNSHRYNLLKVLFFVSTLIIFSCDEDYVKSLSTDKPVVYLQTNDNLNSLYLGEPVENIELILKIENSPAISQLAFSVDFNSDYLNADDIVISSQDDNLFYNINPDGEIYFIAQVTDSGFEGNIGFSNNNQDTTYTYGDGEIARLYLSGVNAQTEFNLSIDQALSYDDFDIDVSDWDIGSVFYLGQAIPELYFNNLNYTNELSSPYLSMFLSVDNLPVMTKGAINIEYDDELLFFINETNSTKGNLIAQGFDVSVNENLPGNIQFVFEHSDGNLETFTQGSGDLIELKFAINNTNFQSQSSPIIVNQFLANFIESNYDICGDCPNPNYSQYYSYDINYWSNFDEPIAIHFGCTDSNALNYNSQAIIDDGTCNY